MDRGIVLGQRMNTVGKILQTATAGAGFLVGYGWAVLRWGVVALGHDAPVRWAEWLVWGAALSTVYALLLGGLFWPWIPTARTGGLRVVTSPVAFTVSFLVGALGIQAALRALG